MIIALCFCDGARLTQNILHACIRWRSYLSVLRYKVVRFIPCFVIVGWMQVFRFTPLDPIMTPMVKLAKFNINHLPVWQAQYKKWRRVAGLAAKVSNHIHYYQREEISSQAQLRRHKSLCMSLVSVHWRAICLIMCMMLCVKHLFQFYCSSMG